MASDAAEAVEEAAAAAWVAASFPAPGKTSVAVGEGVEVEVVVGTSCIAGAEPLPCRPC